MKSPPLLLVTLLLSLLPVIAADPAKEDKPLELPPYQVEERAFGFLGIKHGTVGLNPFKFVVGMKSIRFLQIDELDPASPGVAAGILPGDRIASIDGKPIAQFGLRELKRMNSELAVGQKLIIEILRPSDGSTRTMEVIVPPRKQGEPARP